MAAGLARESGFVDEPVHGGEEVGVVFDGLADQIDQVLVVRVLSHRDFGGHPLCTTRRRPVGRMTRARHWGIPVRGCPSRLRRRGAVGVVGAVLSVVVAVAVTASYLGLFSGMSEDLVNETMKPFRAEGLFSKAIALPNVQSTVESSEALGRLAPIMVVAKISQPFQPFLATTQLDDMTVGVGRVVERLGQAIESNPIAKLGLMVLNVAAGPAAFAVRQAVSMAELGRIIERGQEQALNYLVNSFDLAGYGGAESASGAIGTMALGSALLSGATKAVGGTAD